MEKNELYSRDNQKDRAVKVTVSPFPTLAPLGTPATRGVAAQVPFRSEVVPRSPRPLVPRSALRRSVARFASLRPLRSPIHGLAFNIVGRGDSLHAAVHFLTRPMLVGAVPIRKLVPRASGRGAIHGAYCTPRTSALLFC